MSFAALTGDWHPQHADAEWAAASRFGSRVAHGMLVVSYAVGLVGFDPERVVALRGLDGVVFKRPVTIGDTIHVEGAVDAVRRARRRDSFAGNELADRESGRREVARATVTDLRGRGEFRARAKTAATDAIFDELFL